MTFYNIIFGILFLGACQAVLLSLNRETDTGLITLVALMIFNDAVNTAEAVEERKFDYTIGMKLIDLASFLVLATTLILLSENTKNFLDAPIYSSLPEWIRHPSVPPALLLVYCGLVAGWNRASKDIWKRSEWPWYLIASVIAIVIALLVLVGLRPSRLAHSTAYALVTGIAVLGTLGYLVSYSFIKKEQTGSD
jgi:cytochrome bd-type quinol oxidase subunit 2